MCDLSSRTEGWELIFKKCQSPTSMKTKDFWKALLQCAALLFQSDAYLLLIHDLLSFLSFLKYITALKGKMNIVNHVICSYVLNSHFSVSDLSTKTRSVKADFNSSSHLIFAVSEQGSGLCQR